MADDGVRVTRAQYPRLYCHTDPPPDNLLYYTVLHCTVLYCTVLYPCTVTLIQLMIISCEQSRDQILRLLLLGSVMLPWEHPSYFYTALARAK